MKRKIVIILLLGFLVIACSPLSEKKEFKLSNEVLRFSPEIKEEDRLVSTENRVGGYFAKGEEGVYFVVEGIVYYLPEGQGEAVKLFAINHIDGKYSSGLSLNSTSEAIIVEEDHGISYHEGKLYFLCKRSDGKDFLGYSLISIHPDGSNLSILHDMNVGADKSPANSFLHRGSFFYRELYEFMTENASQITGRKLHRLYLDSLEELVLETPYPVFSVYSLGNYLILTLEKAVGTDKAILESDYYVYDLNTDTLHPMGLQGFLQMGWFNDCIITKQDGYLISFNPKTGDITKHFETKASNFLSDGEYLCLEEWTRQQGAGYNNNLVTYKIYDQNFNLYHETEPIPWTGDPVGFSKGKYYKFIWKWKEGRTRHGMEYIDFKKKETSFTTLIKNW